MFDQLYSQTFFIKLFKECCYCRFNLNHFDLILNLPKISLLGAIMYVTSHCDRLIYLPIKIQMQSKNESRQKFIFDWPSLVDNDTFMYNGRGVVCLAVKHVTERGHFWGTTFFVK
jgi:hypothetical protein